MININFSEKNKSYYDAEVDILWVVFKEGEEERYEEITPGVNAEFDKEGNLIGIELTNATKQLITQLKTNTNETSIKQEEISFTENEEIPFQSFRTYASPTFQI